MTLAQGEQFPDVNFITEDNRTLSTGSLMGQTTVLYFYPEDDTPGCTKEACAFRDRMGDYEQAGIQVYGISLDSPESHRRFREKYDLNFPLLTDKSGKAARALGVLGEWGRAKRLVFSLANALGVSGKREVAKRATFLLNDEGRIARIYRAVSPETHADEIIEDAKALGSNLPARESE